MEVLHVEGYTEFRTVANGVYPRKDRSLRNWGYGPVGVLRLEARRNNDQIESRTTK